MPIRTDIPNHDCGLAFSNGQIICADDIEAILDFAKAALAQGDTVVSEGNRATISESTLELRSKAAIGYDNKKYNVSAWPVPIVARWDFENAGQGAFSFIARVQLGNRTVSTTDVSETTSSNVTYTQHVKFTLHDHAGGSITIFDSQATPVTPNVPTVISIENAHGLALPTPGQSEAWYMQASLTHIVDSGAWSHYATINNPDDGIQGVSLKLYTVCP